MNPPLLKSIFKLAFIFFNGNFLFSVLVYLINNKIERFAPVTKIFGKSQIIL
ncbi:hypothetical protein D3C75_722130 [compost metagenome]